MKNGCPQVNTKVVVVAQDPFSFIAGEMRERRMEWNDMPMQQGFAENLTIYHRHGVQRYSNRVDWQLCVVW